MTELTIEPGRAAYVEGSAIDVTVLVMDDRDVVIVGMMLAGRSARLGRSRRVNPHSLGE